MEKQKGEFSVEDYMKELDEMGPYPAGITPGGLLRRQCRELYEGSGLEGLIDRIKKYACSPFAK